VQLYSVCFHSRFDYRTTLTNTTNTDDIEKDLKKLKDLLDKGLIEQEEYKSIKKELLDRI